MSINLLRAQVANVNTLERQRLYLRSYICPIAAALIPVDREGMGMCLIRYHNRHHDLAACVNV